MIYYMMYYYRLHLTAILMWYIITEFVFSVAAVCDIGTASFKYDMRRLGEILSFPKAWYRRNLARRLFLGDESWADEEGGWGM